MFNDEKRRCRPLRVESTHNLWQVTTKAVEGRHWLHPLLACGMNPPNRRARRQLRALEKIANRRLKRVVNERNAHKRTGQLIMDVPTAKRMLGGLVGAAAARALELAPGVELYAIVVMSNHLHLVLRAPRKNLSRFMQYFKAFITKQVNMITGTRGTKWWRRYDAQPILCSESACERVGYTIGNPVAANLVAHPEDWPSLNLAYGFADASLASVQAKPDRDELTFEYFSATAWYKARTKERADLSNFVKKRVLTIKPLPGFEHLTRQQYKRAVLRWVKASIEKQQTKAKTEPLSLHEYAYGREMPAHGKPLGLRKVIAKEVGELPTRTKRSKRPYAFGTPEAVREYQEAMSFIEDAYANVSEEFRNGNLDVEFPDGTYPPMLPVTDYG